jgi:hypothetical protein
MTAINLVAMPSLDIRRRQTMLAPLGSTVEDLVRMAMPAGVRNPRFATVKASIGGHEIDPSKWRRVRPRGGTQVLVRLVPHGAGGRGLLGTIVTIAAVAASALVLGPAVAGSLSLAQGSTAYAAATSLTALAVTTAASFLINALIPQQPAIGASVGDTSATFSVNGFQNSASPGGAIPNVLGFHRCAPPYAALPYTEISGNNQYIVALFNFGYGPLEISNVRLGETLISNFDSLETESRSGFPYEGPVTLYSSQVIEESFETSALGGGASNPTDSQLADLEVVRTTARNSAEASIDLTFPEGLVEFDGSGNPGSLSVNVRIRQRLKGTTVWSTVIDPLTISGSSRAVKRVTYRWTLPTRGQYEVGVTRRTATFNAQSQLGVMAWSAMRSFRPEYPIAFDKPLALYAVRVKATDQLNGVINNLNADCRRICLDWDATSGVWVYRATNNPASLFRYALQGNANPFPWTDDQIDLEGLQDWHAHCVANGLAYNRVHDSASSLSDVLRDIAAAGRASPRHDGTRWTVVVDKARTIVQGHISPRNSWGFAGERPYLRKPDGFRVSFPDETQDYATVEQVIPWPGFVGDPEVTEEILFPGVTNPAQIFKAARRRQYEIERRLDSFTVNQDSEALAVSRGDLVVANHPTLNRVHTTARVSKVDGDFVVLDTAVTLDAETAYGCRFRKADGTSLLKTILNAQSVETDRLLLDHGDMPEAGDLALLGPASNVVEEVIVSKVEVINGLDFRLTLVPHAPELDELADADELPDWAA